MDRNMITGLLAAIVFLMVSVFSATYARAGCTTMDLGNGMTTTSCDNGYNATEQELGNGMTITQDNQGHGWTEQELGNGMTITNDY